MTRGKPGGRTAVPPPTAELLEKERNALELRRAGYTYDRIADRLGYANKGAAYKAVRRGIARTLQEPVDELIELETDRLDRLLSSVWAPAMKGDLGAVDRVLRISERRSKLLGLDRTPDVDAGLAQMQLMLHAKQLELFETAMLAMLSDLRIDATDPGVRTIIGTRLMEAGNPKALPYAGEGP